MASFCTDTCSVIGAFTEAGMIRLAGGLWAGFLDHGPDSGWESTLAFFLGLPGPLFFAGDCKEDCDRADKIVEEQRMIFETSAQFQSQNPQKMSQEIFWLFPGSQFRIFIIGIFGKRICIIIRFCI